jgi:hypothetical protein
LVNLSPTGARQQLFIASVLNAMAAASIASSAVLAMTWPTGRRGRPLHLPIDGVASCREASRRLALADQHRRRGVPAPVPDLKAIAL